MYTPGPQWEQRVVVPLAHGGPAVFPYINPDLFQSSTSRTWPGQPDRDPSTWRRSIYVFSKRSIRYPLFEAFDQPDMISSCDRRNRSTVAPQALLLMNNAFINMQAKFFAQRVQMEAGADAEALGVRSEYLELRKTVASISEFTTKYCYGIPSL